MRNLFISGLEKLLGIAVILFGIAVIATAIMTFSAPQGGLLRAIMVLAGGLASEVLAFGFIYLQLGIHANTRRTAEAVEALARRA